MFRAFLITALLLCSIGINVRCQPSFLSSTLNTAGDDQLYDTKALSHNRHVFVATVYGSYTAGERWTDGRIFITDGAGNLVRERVFEHTGDSGSTQFYQVYSSGAEIDVFGLEGFLDPASSFPRPVNQTLVWLRLDTMLNTIQQLRLRLDSGAEVYNDLKTVRLGNSVYVIATFRKNYNGSPHNLRPRLIKFASDMTVVLNKVVDASLYNSALNYNAGHFFDISADEVERRIYVTGEVRLSTSNDSLLTGIRQALLHRFDTAFNLVDTFDVSRVGSNNAGADTFLQSPQFNCLPLSASKVALGSHFYVTTTAPLILRSRSGLSVYDLSTRRHKVKALVPGYDSADNLPPVAVSQGLAKDIMGSIYVNAATEAVQFSSPFPQIDNKLIVAKYDTVGNKVWHRFLGSAGGHYYSSRVYPEGDSIVTVLACRYDYISYPNSLQWDNYVLRLRTSDGSPTAIFQVPPTSRPNAVTVFPNPATTMLNIQLAKTPIAAASLTLYNTTGGAVLQATFSGAETSFPIADLPPGVYTYRVTSADKNGIAGSGLFLKK